MTERARPSADGIPSNVRVVSMLAADDSRYDITDARALAALTAAEDAHFWHRSRNAFIEARLRALGVAPPARVLEIGCGGGCVSAHLARAGYAVTGVEGHFARVVLAASRAPTAEFVVHDLSRGFEPLGVLVPFDAAGLFDVIEHLDAPGDAVAEALRTVRPGGTVVGTVPALMALWSQVDVHAGHRHRYDRATLARLLDGIAGASLVEVVDYNRHLVPLLWLQRRWVGSDDASATAEANFRVPSRIANSGMMAAAALERRLEPLLSRFPLPGASLWFALRRDPDSSR